MKFIKKFLGTVLVVAILAGLGYAAYKSTHIDGDSTLKSAGQSLKGPGGDTYYDHSGSVGEAKTETTEEETVYSISGAWLWNEELTPAPAFESVGAVEIATFAFTSAKKIDAQKSAIYYSGGEQVMLYYLGERMVDVYDGQYGWWDETIRFLDCGAEDHTVSKEFYDWFTANAKPAEKTDYLKLMEAYVAKHANCQMSGYWMWNSYIEPCEYLDARNEGYQTFLKLFGTVAGFRTFTEWFKRFDGAGNGIFSARGGDGGDVRWQEAEYGWSNYSHRFFYLGEDPQTLPSAEYAYFIQNARPCTKEEYDTAALNVEKNRPSTRVYGPGEAVWAKDPDALHYGENLDWEIHAGFFSGGEYFTVMYGQWDDDTNTYIVQYGTKYGKTTVFTTKDGWLDEAYKSFTIDVDGLRVPTGTGGLFLHGYIVVTPL